MTTSPCGPPEAPSCWAREIGRPSGDAGVWGVVGTSPCPITATATPGGPEQGPESSKITAPGPVGSWGPLEGNTALALPAPGQSPRGAGSDHPEASPWLAAFSDRPPRAVVSAAVRSHPSFTNMTQS